MITITTEEDTQRLDDLIDYLNDFQGNIMEVAHKVALEVYQLIRADMLKALQFYPPVPPGSTYKRTYKLRRGWDINITLTSDSIELVVFNPIPYTKWVVGKLTNVNAEAIKTQRGFHAKNGWPIALDTSRFWFDIFKDEFIKQFVKAIIEAVS